MSLQTFWREVTQLNGAPKARSSHSVAVCGKKAYVFGGEFEPRVPIDNLVYAYDLENRSWSIIEGKGEAPAPRVGVTLVAVDNLLYVFAGRDKEHKELNELFSFNVDSGEWKLLSSGAKSPPERSYHAFAADERNQKLYTFGGCGKDGRLNDLWVYDIKSGEWEAQSSSSSCIPRGGPGLVVVNGAVWVIFGFNGCELTDIHRYDLATKSWEEIEATGEKPTGRSVFGTSVFGKYILIYGGEVDPSDQGHLGAGAFSCEIYLLDTELREWSKPEVTIEGGKHPGARGWYAFSSYENSMLVYGGNSDSNDRLEDMFLLTLEVDKNIGQNEQTLDILGYCIFFVLDNIVPKLKKIAPRLVLVQGRKCKGALALALFKACTIKVMQGSKARLTRTEANVKIARHEERLTVL
ncbi:hypothetical protein R1flu_006267 [Riccia fluitans]|uniref:Uncharacterized protein n=1 Tax=Riccia fluitans TaxID=41844 RepID=A0ABD1YVJ0_9MARC